MTQTQAQEIEISNTTEHETFSDSDGEITELMYNIVHNTAK